MNPPEKIYVPATINPAGPMFGAYFYYKDDDERTRVEYIRADIHEAQIDALKADNAELKFLLKRVIGEHSAPGDCYSTGPLTGDPIADLISCPSCSALDYLAGKEKK